MEIPIDRFLNWIYSWIMAGRSEEEQQRIRAKLYTPFPGDTSDIDQGPWSEEEMAKSFNSFSFQLG